MAFFHAQGIRGTHTEIELACEHYGYHPLSLRLLAGLIIGDFQQAFEDDDEPVAGLDDVQDRVADVLSQLDPAVNNGSLSVAGAETPPAT